MLDHQGPRAGNSRKWLTVLADLAGPVVAAVVLSLLINRRNGDIEWLRPHFSPATESWPRGDEPLWRLIYEIAALPAIGVGAAAILILVAGFRRVEWRRWRRVAWFFLALLILGPGLIANLWMKEQWGRPRPREVEEFGGRAPFESVFAMDFSGEGKSFPCGHATMGFFFVGAWFLLRKARPGLGLLCLVLALLWGGLIGYARMIQGGHFPTDVVWSAAVMWIAAALLFYLLGMDGAVLSEAPDGIRFPPGGRPIPLGAKIGGGLALAVLVLAALLGTPYREVRDLAAREDPGGLHPVKGSVTVWLGDSDVIPAPAVRIEGEAWGHGVPTSKIADRWEESLEEGGGWRFKYHQRPSGYLTEIRQRLRIGIPWSRVRSIKFDLGPGETRLVLPPVAETVRVELVLREGQVVFEVEPGASLWFEPGMIADRDDVSSGAVCGGGERPGEVDYHVTVTERTGGRIEVRSAGGGAERAGEGKPEPAPPRGRD